MTASPWILVVAIALVGCVAATTAPAKRTAQLFIATSDDRIVRLDEWRQQEVRGWCALSCAAGPPERTRGASLM